MQPREAAADRTLITGLQYLLHHRLTRIDFRLRCEVLLQPVRHTLLVMKATQDVSRARHQGGIGL
jgi:hypothetical protein